MRLFISQVMAAVLNSKLDTLNVLIPQPHNGDVVALIVWQIKVKLILLID